MSNVHFPVQIVALFRRLVNVISTLSISNQYLFLTRKCSRVEELGSGEHEEAALPKSHPFWSTYFPVLEWQWWTYAAWRNRLTIFEEAADILQRPILAHQKVHNTQRIPARGQHNNIHPQNEKPHGEVDDIPKHSDTIHHLLQNPALYCPIRAPRYPIVLCHGLYGFDVRGPASFPKLRVHYWSNLLSILKEKIGAEVIVTSVPGTGSIASRSETLHRQLQDKASGRAVNFLAHSMGGLDCRHLISRIKPIQYAPLSLTTISTPHRGSPFMDWCASKLGIGKLVEREQSHAKTIPEIIPALPSAPPPTEVLTNLSSIKPEAPFPLSLASLPSSFTTLLLSIVDSPAYANLTTSYLTHVFNPQTPDDPHVRYFSVAGRTGGVGIWHPLWLPKMVLDGVEERTRQRLKDEWERERGMYVDRSIGCREDVKDDQEKPLWLREDEWGNDGLVTVQSARWGEFLGTMEGCDHWTMRGARGMELGVDLKAIGGGGGNNGGDGWAKLVGAWKRVERNAEVAAAHNSGDRTGRMPVRDREQERADEALIKSSTDKLSAVFDWLVEQVPVSRRGNGGKSFRDAVLEKEREATEAKRKDLDTKMDLERFYVALSRKLYDEGL